MPPTHAFDIQRRDNIIAEWRELERKTAEAREENRKGQKMPVPLSQNTTEPVEPVISLSKEQLLGKGKEEAMVTTPVKSFAFGESLPLSRNAPKLSPTEKKNEGHAKRWASYGSLPAAFEPALVGVVEKSGRFMEEQNENEKRQGKEKQSASLEAQRRARIIAEQNAAAGSSKKFHSPDSSTKKPESGSTATWTNSHTQFAVPDFVLDLWSSEELRMRSLSAGEVAKAKDNAPAAKDVHAGSSKLFR